jgi:hypothetical protein
MPRSHGVSCCGGIERHNTPLVAGSGQRAAGSGQRAAAGNNNAGARDACVKMCVQFFVHDRRWWEHSPTAAAAEHPMTEAVPAWALTSLLSEQEGTAHIQEIKRLVAANPAVISHVSCSGKRTALIEAAVREHAEAVAFLLSQGAAVDATDDNGFTALHWACQQGNVVIATSLLDQRANVSARTSRTDRTPVHLAAEQSNADVLRVLASRGADMNARQGRTESGETPLHLAVHWERVGIAKTLLELGADMFAKDSNGKHPANLAYELYGRELYPGHVHAMRKVFIDFKKPDKKPEVLVEGCRVRIQGLISCAQHNGKQGVLQRFMEDSQRSGHRWARCVSPAECFCIILPLSRSALL